MPFQGSTSKTSTPRSTCFYTGSEAEDVLVSLHLTEEEFKGYSKLTAGFERYFVPCRNVIHERVRFSQRRQMDHEAASSPSQEQHRVRQDTQEEYQYLFYPPSEPNWSEWKKLCVIVRRRRSLTQRTTPGHPTSTT